MSQAKLWFIVLMSMARFAVAADNFSGKKADSFLLPNGWKVAPAGEQIPLTDLPLNIAPLADGRHALVATSGFNAHELSLIDLQTRQIVQKESVRQSWFGLTATPDQQTWWWSGGGGGALHKFKLENGKLVRLDKGDPTADSAKFGSGKRPFSSGTALDTKRNVLYSLDINYGKLTATDLSGKKPPKTVELGGRPYDIAIAPNGSRLYVSEWSTGMVLAINPEDLLVTAKISVGVHPNQFAVSPTDDRIFVACASTNNVAVIDTHRGVVTESIFTALFPKAPEGSTPDAVAISPDGKSLYVANADNNCVAAVDISVPSQSQVRGFIPTGWYPTAVAVTPDGKSLLIGVGKGNQTHPNPLFKDPDEIKKREGRQLPFPYIGTTLSGSLSIVPMPSAAELAAYTETVYRNCPYSDKLLASVPHGEKTAIPTKVGDPSPIKYVLYIIKENRTFDQVFGDMGRGNCDPELVMFGAEVSPNHHKLANEFVLLDNLYCNGHVSVDGHAWSTMAYNTDYIAKNWAITYSGRPGVKDDDEGNLQKAPSGYIWDACARNNISYRSYGEYGHRVSQPDGSMRMDAEVPGLVGHICPNFAIEYDPSKPSRDTDDAEIFLKEFREFERTDSLPRFMVMSLGEDHTRGTTPGAFTPQACVASNDLALGRIVEALSKSKYWPQMAIFVIEDDAQNGPDHVDAHRTAGLVISPFTKRNSLDSTQYSTVSMLRTIELILGIDPLSQFDAAANPMFACFTDKPNLTPYTAEPARINLNAKNETTAYGAERSSRMDFSEYDRIDDFELNEILWRSIKGMDAPVPPAARRAIAYRTDLK